MIKELIHDPILLSVKSEKATIEDLQVAQDLLETLTAHKDSCVGMAANMIGVQKRIIAFDNDGTYMVMFNPDYILRMDTIENESRNLFYISNPKRKYCVDRFGDAKIFSGKTIYAVESEITVLFG